MSKDAAAVVAPAADGADGKTAEGSGLVFTGSVCVRSQVEGEIRMLLDRLRGAAATAPFSGSGAAGRDLRSVAPCSSAKERAVYEYIDQLVSC
eukprot:363759-Chlamydomonas_euryale.AAC.8